MLKNDNSLGFRLGLLRRKLSFAFDRQARNANPLFFASAVAFALESLIVLLILAIWAIVRAL
jgi:hypothetical protein